MGQEREPALRPDPRERGMIVDKSDAISGSFQRVLIGP